MENYVSEIKMIANEIINSKHLVIFTGAGISTPSGLPDYRGEDGVWTRRDKGLKPRPLKKNWDQFEPNIAHQVIVELQNMGILKFLISQNVDGLHIKSGINIRNIAELHGNSTLMKCLKCNTKFRKEDINWDENKFGKGYRTDRIIENQPICIRCNGRIISSIINFGDPMPYEEMLHAKEQSLLSDVYIVIGSSLVVYPAAELPLIAKNNSSKLIIINKGETKLDGIANVKIDDDCAEVLPKILEQIKKELIK